MNHFKDEGQPLAKHSSGLPDGGWKTETCRSSF